MKNKQLISIAAIIAIAAGTAFYFLNRKQQPVKNDHSLDEANEQPQQKKRVHQTKSPIRKFTRKAKEQHAVDPS